MALFSKKTAKKTAVKPEGTETSSVKNDVSHVLKRPRITEKATINQMTSVYVFDVAVRATKRQIMQAVEQYYKVRPRKVTVVTIPQKKTRNMRTGTKGITAGGKKAYVYLKKGETITLA